jgi:glycogen operon protein
VLHRSRFLHGRDVSENGVKDITWIAPGGGEMAAWHDPRAKCVGLMLNGKAGGYRRSDGRPADDNVLLIVMNAHHDVAPFTLPAIAGGVGWCRHLDTTNPEITDDAVHAVGEAFPAPGRSLILFICHPA